MEDINMTTMMQRINTAPVLTLVVALALLVTGHGVRAEDSVERAIVAATVQWDAAFNSGDAGGVTALYAADAILVPPGNEVVRGHDAIRAFWAGLIEAGFGEHAIEVIEIRVAGDTAHAIASWQARGPGDDGSPVTYSGRLVNVFQRQDDGQWRSVAHIWN
jgi:uncharacterized protein (TIGR02246 family)